MTSSGIEPRLPTKILYKLVSFFLSHLIFHHLIMLIIKKIKKVKLSPSQDLEAYRVVRC
jgi:hypothetical protein